MLKVTSICSLACKRIAASSSSSSSSRTGRALCARGFAVSSGRSRGAGSIDKELSAKLSSEFKLETDMRKDFPMPTSVKDYVKNGQFEIHDKAGESEVRLSRKFGDETIEVFFSISDPDSHNDSMLDEEMPMDEGEEPDAREENVSSSSATMSSKDNEIMGAEGDDEEIEPEDSSESFPVRCNIIVKKPGAGAMAFDTNTQDAVFVIYNVNYSKTNELASAKSAEAEWQQKGMYTGPDFAFLDEDLQGSFERYLEERGINAALAAFIPNYIDYKEQKEYISWLQSKYETMHRLNPDVRRFVEA